MIHVTNLENCLRDAGHCSHKDWGQSKNDCTEPLAPP